MPVLFPVHPRTRARLDEFGLASELGDVQLIEPQGYLETIGLVERARLVLTDSGGLQVETTVLGVPCLTARTTTEWTETVAAGTNRLVPPEAPAIRAAIEVVCSTAPAAAAPRPPLWDGRAAERAVAAMLWASSTR
jgi:UDP-N-acetylglucosamine 2-epimerase (non-hydrolysing)